VTNQAPVAIPVATAATSVSAAATAPLPKVWRMAAARAAIELRVFARDKQTVGFIVIMPAILLVLLASIFGSQPAAKDSGVTIGQFYTAGLIAGGIAGTSFTYLGITIAQERGNGTLKWLAASPMPRTAYFAGKIIQVVLCALAETALLLAVGVAFYHVSLPADPARWLTFAWVFLLGTAACAVAGIAMSSLPKSPSGAGPIVSLTLTVLSFISGVYVVPLTVIPAPLRDIASLFPLKWLAQGLRSVFLPASAVHLEAAGSWQHGTIALVLIVWIAGGLVVCARTFRWQPR
jgi:ABC-2 type transport system permease protein